MESNKPTPIFTKLLYTLALLVLLVAFVNLFTVDFDFGIPFISNVLTPYFDQYAIKAKVWDSGSAAKDVVNGAHWVFLIAMGVAILLATLGRLANPQPKAPPKKRKRTKLPNDRVPLRRATPIEADEEV